MSPRHVYSRLSYLSTTLFKVLNRLLAVTEQCIVALTYGTFDPLQACGRQLRLTTYRFKDGVNLLQAKMKPALSGSMERTLVIFLPKTPPSPVESWCRLVTKVCKCLGRLSKQVVTSKDKAPSGHGRVTEPNNRTAPLAESVTLTCRLVKLQTPDKACKRTMRLLIGCVGGPLMKLTQVLLKTRQLLELVSRLVAPRTKVVGRSLFNGPPGREMTKQEGPLPLTIVHIRLQLKEQLVWYGIPTTLCRNRVVHLLHTMKLGLSTRTGLLFKRTAYPRTYLLDLPVKVTRVGLLLRKVVHVLARWLTVLLAHLRKCADIVTLVTLLPASVWTGSLPPPTWTTLCFLPR